MLSSVVSVRGNLPEIIRNDEKLYEGNLTHYFKTLLEYAQNLRSPYHNFRHMLHITWLCFQACKFYRDRITPRQMRNLLIAALFHDFDHPGMMGNDDLNITRSIRGLTKHIAPEDRESLQDICSLIHATEYPYTVPSEDLTLSAQILRDADASQGLDETWIQQVVFGLSSEWGKKPLEVLKMQEGFYRGIRFSTDWAQQRFPRELIEEKISEAKELCALLGV